jgi:hypothetical protein
MEVMMAEQFTIERFEIEHNIPIPLRLSEKMPVEKMAMGDSFFVPLTDDRTVSELRRQVIAALQWYRKNTGRHFTVRSVDGGVRVWRIEESPKRGRIRLRSVG